MFDAIVETFLIAESGMELSRILARGELLIVSVAIGSDAIGRMIISQKTSDVLSIIAAGACFVLIILSSLLFAYVSRVNAPENLIIDNVSIVSLLVYFITMMASGSSVLLAERKESNDS